MASFRLRPDTLTAQRDEGTPPMALPTLTPEQRAAALEKAAAARRARTELLTALKNGDETVEGVLNRAESDEIARKTRVVQVLRALPGVGKNRAEKIMDSAGIDAGRKIGGLGARQRRALLDAVSA